MCFESLPSHISKMVVSTVSGGGLVSTLESTLAVRRFDRGLDYAVCPVGTTWVGKRSWRSELRASSSCPIRCVISPKWAIPPPIRPTREAPSAASSSDAPGESY